MPDPVKKAAEFQEQMSGVKAISGATTEEIAQLSNKAKEMGASTKFTATEAGQAMEYMAMAGWKTEDMLGGIRGNYEPCGSFRGRFGKCI